MGTYFRAVHPEYPGKCELANCTAPEQVTAVHKAYLESGAPAPSRPTPLPPIPTRSSAASTGVRTVIRAGWKLAQEAAEPYRAFVFADIGPITDADGEYEKIVDEFLALGAQNFLFETFSDDDDLYGLAAYIKARCPEAFLITSFAVTPDGFTRKGLSARAVLARAAECPLIDAAGFNCVSGPNHLLRPGAGECQPVWQRAPGGRSLPMFERHAQRGYPTIVDGARSLRTRAGYFAARMVEIVAAGCQDHRWLLRHDAPNISV